MGRVESGVEGGVLRVEGGVAKVKGMAGYVVAGYGGGMAVGAGGMEKGQGCCSSWVRCGLGRDRGGGAEMGLGRWGATSGMGRVEGSVGTGMVECGVGWTCWWLVLRGNALCFLDSARVRVSTTDWSSGG